MKVLLKKKMLKRLVNNDKKLDQRATPLVGGGNGTCRENGTVAAQPHDTISDVGITF